MAYLDIMILDEQQHVIKKVHIIGRSHTYLFENFVRSQDHLLLNKLRDFYSDTVFTMDELPTLVEEITAVRSVLREKNVSDFEGLLNFLDEFLDLCIIAIDQNKSVFCFSD